MTKETVLIVGAGASAEYGLPTGVKLKSEISDLLNLRFHEGFRKGDANSKICRAIEIAINEADPNASNINPYLDAAELIRGGMPLVPSIDHFIDIHKGNEKVELCGKLAIVQAVLQAEKNSSLYIDRTNNQNKLNFRDLENTWLGLFFKLLNCRIDQLGERLKMVTFIVFNYDRCVEHYLFHAFQQNYNINSDRATELIRDLVVLHPYGTVGNLPWQSNVNSIGFGSEASENNLVSLSRQIKTFTEGTDPSESSIKLIRDKLVGAQRVIFLGFAYHPMNLDLLRPGDDRKHADLGNTNYFGTGMGISNPDCEVITRDLGKLAGARNVYVRNDRKCAALFIEYGRNLSFAK